jgi:hypothetical protein
VLVEGAAGEALDAVVGEDVAIGGDDGVVFVAEGAGFLWAGDLGCDEAAEPSRGDCSSLPEIDFATGVAFTCWMGAEQVYQPDFVATCS